MKLRSQNHSRDLQCVGVARRKHRSFGYFHTKRSQVKNFQYIFLETLIDFPYPRLPYFLPTSTILATVLQLHSSAWQQVQYLNAFVAVRDKLYATDKNHQH
ncbi:hypothetical protein [Nostoc sp.]|uniref:hypothetical protein n=1 Tax=Nostoc sp. TaxID=1180 RepID=UPI002FFBDFFF